MKNSRKKESAVIYVREDAQLKKEKEDIVEQELIVRENFLAKYMEWSLL